jgi:hypothetical protein
VPERVLAQAQAPERAQEPVLAPELAREPVLGQELAQEPVCWPLALRRVPDARRFCRKRNTRQSPG